MISVIDKLKHALSWRLSRLYGHINTFILKILGYAAFIWIHIYRFFPCTSEKHKHAEEIIISLTSHPPRFHTLHLTLWCLCLQSQHPNKIILWIEDKDRDALPETVKIFKNRGLEIRFYTSPNNNDIGSYRKLIPTLESSPKACIVLADDDCYYGRKWFESLVNTWSADKRCIAYHRANRVRRDKSGEILPYYKWTFNTKHALSNPDTWISSGSGVLIPPNSLHPDTTNHHLFTKLSPRSDEVWMHWMIHRHGTHIKKTPYRFHVIGWPKTQNCALSNENVLEGAKDKQIMSMTKHFGWPGTESERLYG